MSENDGFTIYHNPKCSKSRAALELLRGAGHEPQIIKYLETPPTAERIRELVLATKLPVRQLMRTKEALYKELGLADETLDDAALIAQMVAHPILIERPIVVRGDRVRLCRPPELVQELF